MHLLVLLVHLLFANGSSHDLAMAKFKVFTTADQTHLAITIDKEDLLAEMKAQEFSLELLQSYFEAHTIFTFDGKQEVFKLTDFRINADHLKLNASFINRIGQVKALQIENTCLINVKKHSNIMQIDINNEQKDFRMHEKRTVIIVEY